VIIDVLLNTLEEFSSFYSPTCIFSLFEESVINTAEVIPMAYRFLSGAWPWLDVPGKLSSLIFVGTCIADFLS
jgi:hypothetical protein